MPESYEPNKREVFSEMLKGLYPQLQGNISRGKEGLKNLGLRLRKESKELYPGTIKDFGTMLGVSFSAFGLAPYALATFFRKYIEIRGSSEQQKSTGTDVNVASLSGFLIGSFAGTYADIYSALAYYDLASKGKPEILLFPVATNAVSGIYEIGRKLHKDSRERLIERHRTAYSNHDSVNKNKWGWKYKSSRMSL